MSKTWKTITIVMFEAAFTRSVLTSQLLCFLCVAHSRLILISLCHTVVCKIMWSEQSSFTTTNIQTSRSHFHIKFSVHSLLPGLAHLPRAWWVLKKRRHDDLIAWLLWSFAQEIPLNTGAEQLAATTRRRLAMMHAHLTLTHQEELNRTESTPPGKETGER